MTATDGVASQLGKLSHCITTAAARGKKQELLNLIETLDQRLRLDRRNHTSPRRTMIRAMTDEQKAHRLCELVRLFEMEPRPYDIGERLINTLAITTIWAEQLRTELHLPTSRTLDDN